MPKDGLKYYVDPDDDTPLNVGSGQPQLDLVDEMEWEDNPQIQWVSLEDAGLEEEASHVDGDSGVMQYVAWFSEDEDSRWDQQ